MIFGVLTTNTLAPARDRAEGTCRRSADAARDAVAMARLLASPDLDIWRDTGDVRAI